MSFGLVPGRTTPVMSGHQTATVTTPTCDILPTDSASHCLLDYRALERTYHEDRPADRAVRGHDLFVVGSVCSRKAGAKGCPSLFRVAAGRSDDQRRILVSVRSAQHGRNPRGRSFPKQRPSPFAD